MKVSIIRPNIDKFEIRMERDDELYHACLWANILIDYDAYTISAVTDCGNYAYNWCITKEETFRHLCLRMLRDEDYLLRKFSSETVFDLKASKKLFEELHGDNPKRVEEVNAVHADSDREWVEELQEIGIREPWEYIVKDFPRGAKTFVSILKNVVLPEMKKSEP